jgi:hypothetical protein
MFMISRSNGGQWSGIFGFNPLSLLLKIKQWQVIIGNK